MSIVTYLRLEDIPFIAPGSQPPRDAPFRYPESPGLIHVDCSYCRRGEVVDSLKKLLQFASQHEHRVATSAAAPEPPQTLFDLTNRTHPR